MFKGRWLQKQNKILFGASWSCWGGAWWVSWKCYRPKMFTISLSGASHVWKRRVTLIFRRCPFLSSQLPQYRCFLRNPGCQLASQKSEMTLSWLFGGGDSCANNVFSIAGRTLAFNPHPENNDFSGDLGEGGALPCFPLHSCRSRGKAHCYAEVGPFFKPWVDAGWMCCHESCMLGLHNSLEVFMYELSQGWCFIKPYYHSALLCEPPECFGSIKMQSCVWSRISRGCVSYSWQR